MPPFQFSFQTFPQFSTKTFKVWRYGKSDLSRKHYGNEHIIVGCSKAPSFCEAEEALEKHKKWLVNVQSPGCLGIFYRSAPNVIVPDADWPRNGDIVIGSEIPNIPGKCIYFFKYLLT